VPRIGREFDYHPSRLDLISPITSLGTPRRQIIIRSLYGTMQWCQRVKILHFFSISYSSTPSILNLETTKTHQNTRRQTPDAKKCKMQNLRL
jgi:hypothetical protein